MNGKIKRVLRPSTPDKPRRKKRASTRATGHIRDAETAFPGLPALNVRCFGCSPINPRGMRLKFEENPGDVSVECVFRISRHFEGPPGHAHGGIIAAVLDEAMGKVNRQKSVVALTRHMSIDFLRPVPLGVKLVATGRHVSQDGRKHFHTGEIRSLDGGVLARSAGVFIAIDPVKMFRELQRNIPNAGPATARR